MASPDIQVVVDSVERKIYTLENFAIKHRLNGASLPPLPAPRTYKTSRALHYAIEATLVKIENIAASIPRVVSTGRSHIQAKTINYDPGELFQSQMNPAIAQLKNAATEIAKLSKDYGPACGIVLQQTDFLAASIRAEASVISRASKMAKPSNPVKFKQHCEELIDVSAEVAELKYDIDVHSPLHNHGMALGDTAAALGWVVAPAPLKHARDYKAIVNTLAEDILSRYIDLGCNPIHSDFAESLNAVMDVVATYVEKEHPAGLRWNYAQGATPAGYKRASRNLGKDSHPIGDFYKIMHSGLTEYIVVSKELGGTLKTISDYTLGVYEEMAKVVETASGKSRPTEDTDATLRMMLMSVQHELTPLIAFLERVSSDDRYVEHCIVFREFINIMQWCTATVQKMSSVGYIIDIEAVTLVYIDKLERDFSKKATYVARIHKGWTNSLRKMMVEMKEYVKMHHPNELMFDTRRTRQSVDKIVDSSSISNQILVLKAKSTGSVWKRGTRIKMVSGKGKISVPTWVKDK